MGVPKFAAWLTKKYPAMVTDRCPANVHGLYIDLNGLIHPCCHDEQDATVALRTELEKMRCICFAIETLVVTVKPRKVVYIAIDGVAPRAKMNQQRARRYMSAGAPLTNTEKPIYSDGCEVGAGVVAAIEKEFTAAERTGAEQELEDINQALMGDMLYGGGPADDGCDADLDEHPQSPAPATAANDAPSMYSPEPQRTPLPPDVTAAEPSEERFDSNCISPGTAFMDRVAAAVRDFVRRKLAAAATTSPTPAEAAASNAASNDELLTLPSSVAAVDATPATPSPWADLTVVISDSNTAGEGEHKFLDFIRTQSAFPGFNGQGCHVIAGLDADLIFLSLSLHIPHIVILRDHDRSSYEKALLPVSTGGTLASNKSRQGQGKERGGKARAGAAALPASGSTSSIGSAALTTESEEASVTPLPSNTAAITTPSSHREEDEHKDANEANDSVRPTEEEVSEGRKSSVVSNPSPAVSSLPHIATVAADVCTSYEFFDIDVVSSSLVSEVYQLWLEKGMEVQGNPLENLENCMASNGFIFHHGSGGSSRGRAKGSSNSNSNNNNKNNNNNAAEGIQPAPSTAAKVVKGTKSSSARSAASPSPLSVPAFHPCTSTSNSKIIDDFIVLGMLLGNDFLPHSPSVYCGESAFDTLLDVYVSAVLPHGYLTGGLYEIQLRQLERLFRAYAAVEAVRFRQHAIQAGKMTPQEAATAELYSAADRRCWRDVYIRTTSLKDEAGVTAACRAYVEGLRFVWRYYSSISLQVSWSWYYPFHHAPLALDVADFLRAQGPDVQVTLAAPKLERRPPPPFSQLLCILPPTSRQLVPAVLRPVMAQPPPELVDTFPTTWTVDFTGAYGKDHLAAVLLPFANLPDLQRLVEAHAKDYSAEERTRNVLRSTHLVIEGRANAEARAAASAGAAETGKPDHGAAAAALAKTRGFHIQGDGLRLLAVDDVPLELRDCTSLVCSSLADTVPPLSRPRTYSYTVPIPGLTVLPDGSRVPLERRPQYRHGSRRRRGTSEKEEGRENGSGAAAAAAADNSNNTAYAAKPSMLFGEFALALVMVGLLTATVAVCRCTTFVNSVLLALQLCGIALTVLGMLFALGLAVANKGRTAGSGMHRHVILTAFADWQCASCLSMNFSRNRRCFICRAPFDPKRCVALFSGRNPPEPPLMDPDHAAYTASYGIISLYADKKERQRERE